MRTPEAGERGIVALQDHLGTGEQEPALRVVGIVRQPLGERSDHRFHRRNVLGHGGRIAGRRPRLDSVRRAEPEIERETRDRHRGRDRDRHPGRRRTGGHPFRLAPAGVGEQAPLEILAQRSVALGVDLAALAFALERLEPLAIQRDVRVARRRVAGGTATQQRRHDQRQRGQYHERGEEPEQEHREPLGMAVPRRTRFTVRNLSGAPRTGKDSDRIHL